MGRRADDTLFDTNSTATTQRHHLAHQDGGQCRSRGGMYSALFSCSTWKRGRNGPEELRMSGSYSWRPAVAKFRRVDMRQVPGTEDVPQPEHNKRALLQPFHPGKKYGILIGGGMLPVRRRRLSMRRPSSA